MRRENRPFVVEVRRGQKKAQPATPSASPIVAPAPSPFPAPNPFAESVSDDEMMRRAEAALFGRPAEPQATAATDAEKPVRRILEAIVPEAELAPQLEPSAIEPKRRGRKPGSKNKPKDFSAPPPPKRPRGRPPKNPEARVRTVPVTPELAQAALAIMEGAGMTPPSAPMMMVDTRPIVPVKRPRGRPRKEPVTPPPVPPQSSLSPGAMSPDRILRRYGPEAGERAGQLWTRRLRGYANPNHRSRRSEG